MYDQIETDIVERLTAIVPAGTTVVRFPENEAELQRPFADARITVVYKGSKYGEPGGAGIMRATSAIVQNEIVQIEVAVQSRFLRAADKGIYATWQLVKRALLGFRPTNCDRMYARDIDLVNNENNVWTYAGTFECSTLAVEEYDDSVEEQGIVTTVTLQSQYNADS